MKAPIRETPQKGAALKDFVKAFETAGSGKFSTILFATG